MHSQIFSSAAHAELTGLMAGQLDAVMSMSLRWNYLFRNTNPKILLTVNCRLLNGDEGDKEMWINDNRMRR